MGKRVALLAAAGALAGFITFIVMEPVISAQEGERSMERLSPELIGLAILSTLAVGALLGGVIGGLLVLTDEGMSGNVRRMAARGGLAAAVGALAGGVGGIVAQFLFAPAAAIAAVTGSTTVLIIGRSIGWAVMGATAGICPGVVARSHRRALQGILGGLAGGALGGMLFDALAAPSQTGTTSRVVGFVAIGMLVGALVALVEEIGKVHWLTVLTGAKEGRTFILAKPETYVGRNELTDIPLFGDPGVERLHARFLLTPTGGVTVEANPGLVVGVNGQWTAAQPLKDGDVVAISRTCLRFRSRRATSAPAMPAIDPARPAQQPVYGVSMMPLDPQIPPSPGVTIWNPDGTPYAQPTQAVPQAATFMPTRLDAVTGPHAGQAFALQHGAVIGRETMCQIGLPQDVKVSRNHARIVQDIGGWRIEDIGSTNGTYVNGQRINTQPLNPGDTIQVGETTLQVG